MSGSAKNPTKSEARRKFGNQLRHWRGLRGVSQLTLACEAGISARHLSFLETGRSSPSRDMIERLSDSLDVPPADRDLLLISAGYAPNAGAEDIAAPDFADLEAVLGAILARHTTVPALAIDEAWEIRMRNALVEPLFDEFRARYRLPERVANNALHILCHPEGMRQFMPDWAAYAEPFVREVQREASASSRPEIERLLREVRSYPGVPGVGDTVGRRSRAAHPVLTLARGEGVPVLAFHTTFTTVSLPAAHGTRGVKIECFYPANAETADRIEEIAAGRSQLPPG